MVIEMVVIPSLLVWITRIIQACPRVKIKTYDLPQVILITNSINYISVIILIYKKVCVIREKFLFILQFRLRYVLGI